MARLHVLLSFELSPTATSEAQAVSSPSPGDYWSQKLPGARGLNSNAPSPKRHSFNGQQQGPGHVSGPEWRGNTRLTQTQDGAPAAAQRLRHLLCNSQGLGSSPRRQQSPPGASRLSFLSLDDAEIQSLSPPRKSLSTRGHGVDAMS